MTSLKQYYTVLKHGGEWWPSERVTRLRNMALLRVGLYLSRAIHLSMIGEAWPVAGKIPSLVNRLRRFLDNERVAVRAWYRPVARQLVAAFGGRKKRLILDTTFFARAGDGSQRRAPTT